ncbi:MAG: ATP-dependent Clp protease proteolytic subunit [Myxococcales bacterium]|nr:ATP-dependent Clp protease proteolytic subunit [Myxococcales bacterium]
MQAFGNGDTKLEAIMALSAETLKNESEADAKDGKKEKKSIEDRMMATRQVLLAGAVNTALAKDINQKLLALESDDSDAPITLMVNSPGGSVTDGFSIYDTIRFIRPPVRIVCAGLCASIATIILIATPKQLRLSLPNTRFLIHQPLIPGQVFGPASDLEITANEILKTRAKINEMLAEACGQPLDKVTMDTQRDYWLTADEAITYGLISGVVVHRRDLDGLTL